MSVPTARVVCPFTSSLVSKAVSKPLQAICTPFIPSYEESTIPSGKSILPFESIPAAKGLPFLGTSLDLIKSGGASQLHTYCDQRHKSLGNIFREKMGNLDCVFVADASLMQYVYSSEGPYPVHAVPEAWTIFNRQRGVQRGLFFLVREIFSSPLSHIFQSVPPWPVLLFITLFSRDMYRDFFLAKENQGNDEKKGPKRKVRHVRACGSPNNITLYFAPFLLLSALKTLFLTLSCFLHLLSPLSFLTLSFALFSYLQILLEIKEGTHWSERRKSLNRVFLKQKTISEYSTVFNEVVTDLLKKWTLAVENPCLSGTSSSNNNLDLNTSQGHQLQNLERELYNWSIECKNLTLLFHSKPTGWHSTPIFLCLLFSWVSVLRLFPFSSIVKWESFKTRDQIWLMRMISMMISSEED